MTERPYAMWELILIAVVLLGWAAIGIRVLAALWRQRQRDRDPINRWRPPPPWRKDR